MVRRVMAAMLLTGFLITGCSDSTAVTGYLTPNSIEQRLQVGTGWVALVTGPDHARSIGYYVADGKEGWRLQGIARPVEPGSRILLDGGMVVAESDRGGAPQFVAYTVDVEALGLRAVDYYQKKAPEPPAKTGHHVVVNKHLNVLWHYADGRLAGTYRVATGRDTLGPAPNKQNYSTNFFTPEGTFRLSVFTENPAYTALKPGDKSYAGGHPDNPLGTRWMGFPVFDWDGGGVWGIHGTNEPEKIGTWASDGCIRMNTADAEALFAALKGRSVTLKIVGK